MSNYILSNGSFCELPDDELMHWKYIKREKVNGKWVYTYPSNADGPIGIGGKTKPTVKTNAAKSETPTGHKLITNNLKWVEQKKWVDGLVADRKARGPIYPDDYDKYRAYQNNPNKSFIDKVKDKLGVDERDIYRDAAWNKHRSEELAKKSKKEADEALDNYKRLDEIGVFEGEYALDRESHWDHYQRRNNVAKMDAAYAEAYGKAYVELREEFLKTPLGKLHAAEEKFDETISNAREHAEDWVEKQIDRLEDLFRSSKNSHKHNKR